jgi:hypothetical protein
MRAVFEGRISRAQALAAYQQLHESHRRGFGILLFFQRLVPRVPVRLLPLAFRIYSTQFLINLTFNAYLRLAPPEFAVSGRPAVMADGNGDGPASGNGSVTPRRHEDSSVLHS